MSIEHELDAILVEQYTIAEETINLALKIGINQSLKVNSSKYNRDEIDLALIVNSVLEFLIKESRY